MADIYKIAVALNMSGTFDRELQKTIRDTKTLDRHVLTVGKSFMTWMRPLQGVASQLGVVSKSIAGLAKSDRALAGWGRGFETRVATVTRNAIADARRMEQAFERIGRSMPSVPAGLGHPAILPGGARGRRSSGHSYREAGALGAVGVYGAASVLSDTALQGAGALRENIRQRQAGITPRQLQALAAHSGTLSRQFPSLTQTDIREQGRLLLPNTADYGKMTQVLPEYLKAQVALQTSLGPDKAAGHMETMAKFIDLIGRSTDVEATNKLLEGYVRAVQLDPEAIKSADFLNAAKTAGTAGKGLSVDTWANLMPLMFMQQGGSRTGTGIMSAYQNTILGRGTDQSLMAQGALGLRVGQQTGIGRTSKQKLIADGSMVDEALQGAAPYEWTKKHLVPELVSRGILPKGYAHGDFSQQLSEEQRVQMSKAVGAAFSNRTGSNIYSTFLGDMSQFEQLFARRAATAGTGSVGSDQYKDPFVVAQATRAQTANLSAALTEQSIADLTKNLVALNSGIGKLTGYFEQNPTAAKSTFGLGLAAVGGAVAAGATALTIAAVGTLSLPALIVGAGAAVTIAALTLPWDDFAKAFRAKSMDINQYIKDELPELRTKVVAFSNEVIKAVTGMGTSFVEFFKSDISTWPGKLTQPIVDFGNAIIAKFKEVLSSLNPLNLFKQGSYDGGDSYRSMIRTASLGGGASNDNAVYGSNGSVARALRGSGASGNGSPVIGNFGGRASSVGAGAGIGHIASKAERAAHIREVARGLGMDPEVALRVAQSEGFNTYVGDQGRSFGDYQLFTGGGLGNIALKQGLNVRDPRTWKEQHRFALGYAKKHGWGSWYGAAKVGVSKWRGINPGRAGSAVAPSSPAPTAGPPPRPEPKTEVLHVNLDGKKVGDVVLKRGAQMARHPTSTGGPDTYGRHHGPSTRLTDAA